MDRLEESGEALLHTSSRAGAHVRDSAKRFFDGFSDFALRDNVLEVAFGLIIASTFTSIVTSLVTDIILPPVSLLPFIDRNLEEKFAVLRGGPSHHDGYNTIKQAQDDGAVVMAYGSFLNKVINFFVVVICLFLIARIYQWISDDTVIKKQVKCKYCRKRISVKAKRCINCTSWQDGREEKENGSQQLI